jgi:hypothetical protein
VNVCRITHLSPADVRELTAGELIAWLDAERPGPRLNVVDSSELTAAD